MAISAVSKYNVWFFLRHLALVFLFAESLNAFAHKNHPHHHEGTARVEKPSAEESKIGLEKINESYKRDVKSIFMSSCFDCHSQSPRLPWYSNVPLVHSLLESDMREAKEHLDFTNDFPFAGHGTPKEDLEAIAESVRDKSMPPFRYRVMHRNSALTDSQRKMVLDWIANSERLLDGSAN
jgi:hypothetical protein